MLEDIWNKSQRSGFLSVAGNNGGDGMVVVDDGLDLLIQLRQSLRHIKNRLLEIEAQFDSLGIASAADKPMTLRKFTEMKLNDKSPDDQEADSSNPRATAEKHSTR
jgi:hypothetical protein